MFRRRASVPATGSPLIWNSHYRRATLFIWIVFSFNSFVLYMYTNYLKVLLPADRVAVDVAGSALSLFSIGAFFGSIGGAFMIRWFGSRYVGTILAFVGVVATAADRCVADGFGQSACP